MKLQSFAGILFHERGATALNARSLKVLHLVLSTSRRLSEFDCSDRAALCS